MLKNYITTALRTLWREKASSIINIAGLTLGITTSLVLFLLIKHAVSYDTFHSQVDRIYRVTTKSKGNDGHHFTPGTPTPLPVAFKLDFPEAKEVVYTSYRSGSLIMIPKANGEYTKYSEEKGVVFTQPDFFRIFDRKIILGDSEKGLDEPNEAIISRKWAIKYFGKEEVVGEVVKYDNQEYRITALMDDIPDNTDLPFELMLSYSTIQKANEEKGWHSTWSDEQTYFLLSKDAAITDIESRIPDFVKKYIPDDTNERTFIMQPLGEIHFDSRFSNYNYNTTPKPVLTALGVVALFLILTACINFINLATAEAIKRSKEVGIRKSLGSTRAQLVVQFLGETFLLTGTSVLFSMAFTQVILRYLNPFLEQNISLNLFTDPFVSVFLMAITIVVTLLSGIYPAIILSGYTPAFAMKNLIGNKSSSGYVLRRSLVISQFFISQLFIIGTLVVIRQMNFIQQKDLGFSQEAIISIPIPNPTEGGTTDGVSKVLTLKNELNGIAGIDIASLNSAPPASGRMSGTSFRMDGIDENFGTLVKVVDRDYIPLFDIKLLAGQNLTSTDTATGFIVNEKLVKTTGIQDISDILGKEMSFWGKKLPVVGVVKDFHTTSLSKPISPLVLFYDKREGFENLSVKITSSDFQGTLSKIQSKWEAAFPDYIFSYEFFEQEIQAFYETQRKMSVLLSVFTSIAIFIGCLGLFGLATFMARQKTKEIGIRKILGATVESIMLRFSREFIILISIGFLLAVPASYFIMRGYLDQYAYRIELGPIIFLTGLGITVILSIFTVGYRSFTAASANPVDSVKYE